MPQLETVGVLSITDQDRFADFAAFILLEPEFEWVVTTKRLRVFALGTIFDNGSSFASPIFDFADFVSLSRSLQEC